MTNRFLKNDWSYLGFLVYPDKKAFCSWIKKHFLNKDRQVEKDLKHSPLLRLQNLVSIKEGNKVIL